MIHFNYFIFYLIIYKIYLFVDINIYFYFKNKLKYKFY